MKKKLSLILIFIMTLVLALTLLACSDRVEDDIDDPITNPVKEKITVPQALQSTYDGIMAGSDVINQVKTYAVESVYTIFTGELNYTVTYKANYAQNKQDSEIYLSFFDNSPDQHRNRLSLYYDSKNLYLLTDFEKKYVADFSMTSMFDAFFELVRYADLSDKMFSETGAHIFNRENPTTNLGLVLDASSVDRNVVSPTRDSLSYTDITLDIISDTVNAYMDNYLGDIGDKFDVITNKYLGFRLSRVISPRFSYIKVSNMNFQRENGVADYAKVNMSGSFRDSSKYQIDAEVGYKTTQKLEIKEKANFDPARFTHVNLGQNNYVGKINIPALSPEDFDIKIVTNIDTKDNAKNELSLDITDAKKSHLMGAYYRDEIMFVDISGLDEQYVKGAIELDAFNLPKVFFENINLTGILNAFYNSGIKMLTTVLDRSFSIGDVQNQDLYAIIMENFDSEGNTIYYTITEELIQLIREDDTRTAVIIADMLDIPVEKLDSILGEEFFSLSTLKISYNLDTGTIGLSYYYDSGLVFKMSVNAEDYNGVIFPPDTLLSTNAYNKLIFPNDIKTELIIEFEVTNAKESSDMSKVLGAFIGDPSGKNTKYHIKKGETLVLKAQASEKFVSLGSSNLVSEYLMRFDFFRAQDEQNPLMSVYTNPLNLDEFLVMYRLPIGKEQKVFGNGVKFVIPRSEVSAGLDAILGENNVFDDASLLGIVSEILSGKSSRTEVSNSGGYFGVVLQAETDPKTGEKHDPVQRLIGVSDLLARVQARFLFSEVVLNDIDPATFGKARLDTKFSNAVGIESLYSPNSNWKDTIEVSIHNHTINMLPNYKAESIKIGDDKTAYTPTIRLFGQEVGYTLNISGDAGAYEVAGLITDTITIDPAMTNRLPTQVEVEFTNGKTGLLDCKIEGLTNEVVSHAGHNLGVFANESSPAYIYTLRIGNNSIMTATFEVRVAVYNRTVIPLTDGDSLEGMVDGKNVPVIGVIDIDPYEYAMRKKDNDTYNPVLAGIMEQDMRLHFNNVYGQHEETGEDQIFNAEGVNYFFLHKLNLNWDFDQLQIKHGGGTLFAYAYYGEGDDTKVKIAIKVNVMAKAIDHVQINDENINTYTIDSLIASTYKIPTQTGIGTDVRVVFGDGTYRIVQLHRPDGIDDQTYYKTYLPTELKWEIPIPNYMENVTLEIGTSELFGSAMDNSTFAEIEIGDLGVATVNLNIEVPGRGISMGDIQSKDAIRKIDEHADGTFTLGNKTQIPVSPVKFTQDGKLWEFFSINPYDENGKLPNEIFMEVYKQYTNSNGRITKKYQITWLTTDANGVETNVLYIDDEGYARLKNPTTDQNDFLVYGIIGDGIFTLQISTWVRNLASKLVTIQYEGMEKDVMEMTIDPYKSYTIPSAFTAELESGEKVYRNDIAWMVRKDGDEHWVSITKPTSGEYDPIYYDKNGKYLFHHEGGTYFVRYILEASGAVLRQEMLIRIEVEARTLVTDTINIYETGGLVTGYTDINYYKADSQKLLDRVNELINDTQKALSVGVGFEEARTDLILDRYNLYVDWQRATPTGSNYLHSIDYLAYILQNPKGEEIMTLQGTILTGTINEQTLSITISLAGLVISNITLINAEYSESIDAVYLPQKQTDGRINMSTILQDGELYIEIPKVFGLTVPVNNLERYASPYSYINYVFERIIMVYYNGTTDSQITPVLDFDDYTEDSFNRKVLGITDYIYASNGASQTIIYIKKLSAGSAQENIKVTIKAEVDEREARGTGNNITAELYNEFGESSTADGYLLPTYVDIPYVKSGIVRYYLGQSGWRTSDTEGAGTATNIELTSINVLSSTAQSYTFYHVLPLQGFREGVIDDRHYYLTVNIPRKNINNTNYTATADDATYNILDGYITIDNAYLFYDNQTTYTSGTYTFKTGFDYQKLPEIINARIVPDYFDSTAINYFTVSWIPEENAITESDIVNGIQRAEQRVLATATILSYYNESGEHVTQTVTVYVEMDAMVFAGIEYWVDGKSLDIRQDEHQISNTIVIDPYDEKIGYNGIFKLPTIGLIIHFEQNQRFTVSPSSTSTPENPRTDDIRRFELLDKDMQLIRTITEIPYGYSGHTLKDSNLPLDRMLYINMVMFTNQNILLTINILSRVVDKAEVENIVSVDGEYQVKMLEKLYYVDPYNSITHQLPTTASIFFLNSDQYTVLPITRWETLDSDTQTYKDINTSRYFYSQTSSEDIDYKYGYYAANVTDGHIGGVFSMRAYISMGTSSSGVNIGEQGFEIIVVALNRSLKTSFATSHEYSDPIAGLLSDIGGTLNESMFVDYDKYYAAAFKEKNIPPSWYYSAISDGPITPQIDWSRYVDDSIISYEGFRDRNIDGYLHTANTNINFRYDFYSNQMNSLYSELIKSMTWDSFFTLDNGKLVPLNYYSTDTNKKLREALATIEIEVKNQTFTQLVQTYNSAENTVALAQRMESVLLRSVMSNNPEIKTEQEGVAFLYDMLATQNSVNNIRPEDRTIFLNWVDLYNRFKGNVPGFVENIDAERLTPYQMLKRDMYDKAVRELYFYGAENNYNSALYAAVAKKLGSNISSAIWQKMYDMATREERARMQAILGQESNVSARAYALSILMISDLKALGSYGERASALISAPQVTFDRFKDDIDTFYFNIYTTLALDEEVSTLFLLNKDAIFAELMDTAMLDVIEVYRKGIISTTLQEYFAALMASMVNTMVPVDDAGVPIEFYYDEEFHTYDYAVDKDTYNDPAKRKAAIMAFRADARQSAIAHIGQYDNESSAQAIWISLHGAYRIKSNTAMMTVMDDILISNNDAYMASLDEFKRYLQNQASSRYDISIEYADKIIAGRAADSLLENPRSIGDANNDVQPEMVFADMYGPSIGLLNRPDDIFALVEGSLDNNKKALFNSQFNLYRSLREPHMRTIYYFLYDPAADPIIKRATEDFFYAKLARAAGKNFFDLLYQQSQDTDFENKASLDIYLNNVDLKYSNPSYDLELRKARVFRSLQTYYGSLIGEGANYRTLIQDIYDAVLIDIKATAYDRLFTNLFVQYAGQKEAFKENRGNIYALAFDYLLQSFVSDADKVIEIYNNQVTTYVEENIYRYAEELYNKAMQSGAFVYATSKDDATEKNYLELTASEHALVESQAVDYYYYNLASSAEKLQIESTSSMFGKYIFGGKYKAPQGVYQYLVYRYDLGNSFVEDLHALRYFCLLDYAQEKIKITINDIYQQPNDAYYTEHYYNVQRKKLNDMGADIFLENAAIEFASKGYINYLVQQVVLKDFLSEKQTIESSTIIPQGRERLYYSIYVNEFGDILDNMGTTLEGITAYYYRLFCKLPQDTDISAEELATILEKHIVLNGDKAVYYDIFADAQATLDWLEKANYDARQEQDKTRNHSIYNQIRELLLQQERQILDQVISSVDIQQGYVKVFDDLILPYYVDEFILPSYVDSKTRQQLKDQLTNIRQDELYVDADMVVLYNEYVDNANDTQRAFIDALSRQEMLRRVSVVVDDHLKTVAYMDLVYLINTALTELAFAIDYDLVELSDIEDGVRTVFSDDAKQNYINLVLQLLQEENFTLASAVLQNATEQHRYASDFVVLDSTDGMSQAEKNEYNAKLDEYIAYLQKIYDNLLLTSMNDMARAYESNLAQGKLLTGLDIAINERIRIYLEEYTQEAIDTSDASYQTVLQKMIENQVVEYKFYTQDHIASDDPMGTQKNKHLVYFDVQVLQEEGNSSTQDINKVYLTNLSKKGKANPDTVIKRDGFRFIYPQIEILYVDYYGVTDVNDAQERYDGIPTTQNSYLNKITIDPLNPDLPSKVRAYGTYRKIGGGGAYGILDVGMINVAYDDIFRSLEGEYAGNAPEGDSSSSYQITAINDKNDEFFISLTVFYLDRTVQSYYVNSPGYTSSANIINSGDYAKYYNLFDNATNKNKIIIDPTAEETVDKDNITYLLPTSFVANYTNYESDIYRNAVAKTANYYNVVWDLTGIKYSLQGLPETPLRVLSYHTSVGDGTYNRLEFDYATSSVSITKYSESDNTTISINTFVGTPQLDIWNLTLTVTTKTVDKIYIRNQDGSDTLFAKFVSDDISGIGNSERWLVAENDYSVNPYYVEFFQNIVLEFSDGDTYQVNHEFDWTYHTQNGVDKLRDIVSKSITEPNNRYIVAGFNYISETVWVKLMVDDIEIERPFEVDENGDMKPGYINGGTIYLLPKDSSNMNKEEQLASFYPYMYYNFSKDKFHEDWRRIPLIFSANDIRNINLNENSDFENIYATLGNNSSGSNISFTVKVINPRLFAQLAGQTNSFVMYDAVSMPVDGNSRVISTSSDMPQIMGNYFMQLNGSGSTLFNILSITYDVVNETVTYQCRYYMNASDVIAGADGGVRTLSFMVVLPLKTYNYTTINDVRFESSSSDKFTWRTVNSFEETDSLFWKLGEKMSPSLLPKGYDALTGKTFEFMWDLDNININLATGEGYYTARAYYYASSAQWLYKEVNIYVGREDISSSIVPDTSLNMVYNGNKYTYELDYTSLHKLRQDGSIAKILEDSVTIEYRISTSSEYNYSTSYRPLNAGTYYIRIRVDDYNFFGEVIITFVIQPYKIKGMPVGMGGQGIEPDIIFAGVDDYHNIEYTYNGQPQGLIVSGGLPYVHVQNWPQTRDQKEYLYLSKLGANPSANEITIAKSAAYNELFGKVTPATQVYLSRFKAQVKLEYNNISENELNARVFDLLDYNLYICEVVPTITYQNAEDVILEREPVDVGSYRYIYNIEASQNNGNYIFEDRTSFMGGGIIIIKPDVSYSLVSNTMVYNGAYQRPLINNLHLPNGNLPIGVSVTYTYRYNDNQEWITTSQVRDVRSYTLTIEINGGNNYPDGILDNLEVSIVPQDMFVAFDEEKTQSQYLNGIVDYGKHVELDGLVGNDRASDFHVPVVFGDVQEYYTLGRYPIGVDGFRLEGSTDAYTKHSDDPVEINGVYYYRLVLKNADDKGSLYTYFNENNRLVYESLINKFQNYNIYVRVDNYYTIYPDGAAILVNTDQELKDAIASVEDNSRVTIYLSEGSYSRLSININASITLIGCYDKDAEIISTLESISIAEGEVTLRIIDIKGKANTNSVYIGNKAGVVSILDCHFDGLRQKNSRAIVTSAHYNGLLYINNTTITGYNRALELTNGTAEIINSSFLGNDFGVSSYTTKEVFIRNCDFISTNNHALYLEHSNHIVVECEFSQNNIAVRALPKDSDSIIKQNTFELNGVNFVSIIG